MLDVQVDDDDDDDFDKAGHCGIIYSRFEQVLSKFARSSMSIFQVIS